MPVADEKWNVIKSFLQKADQKADKNGNGSLSQDEFRNGLVTLGVTEEKAFALVEWVCITFIGCVLYTSILTFFLPVLERN